LLRGLPAPPTVQEDLSSIRCWASLLLVLGIICIFEIYISIPALIVGCMVACGPATLESLKPNLGCVKCASITGIVFSSIGLALGGVVGILFLTTVYTGCEVSHTYVDATCTSTGRMLEAHPFELPTTNHSLELALPMERLPFHAYLPFMPAALETGLAQALRHKLPSNLPAFHWPDDEAPLIGSPKRGLQTALPIANDNDCSAASDGYCDDGGPGSEYDFCRDYVEEARDEEDCGFRSTGTTFGYQGTTGGCGDVREVVGAYCGWLITIGWLAIIFCAGLSLILLIAFTCVCCKAGRLEIAAVAEPTMSGVGMQPAAVPVTYAQPVEGVPVKGGNAV